MKKLIYIFLILLGFTSCMRDDKVTMEPDATDKVDIVFAVNLPEPIINTKVMADQPQVQNLRVAVFGGSGYLKEYVEATPIDKATANTTRYNYKVSLSLTDSHIKVHFIANGPEILPFKYEDEVMSSLMTEYPNDAYWQRIELPNGITAQKNQDGEYIKVDGKYVITEESLSHFLEIPLIRNFAKIEVTADPASTSNFELTSYALVNTPNQGSIAAYERSASKFISGYESLTFAQVKEQYHGNLPATATLNKTIPAATAFSSDPVYMYERPIPTEDATFLLVYGRYTPTNKMCYYRIELQDANGYYAIYRNFKYTVNIKGILREGSDTPTEAANSAGSGDISTDQKAENLTDVSDGVARIFVEYTEKTLVGQGTVTLKFKFLPDASVNTPHNEYVTVTVGDPGASGAVINGSVTIASSDDGEGWRQLSFTSTEPGDVTKTQTIKVTGNYGSGSRLFRNITYKLMKIQDMIVVCDPSEVEKGKGEKVDVLIKIPKDLPRSIFPLQLQIESSALSLTPDNDNLPVQPGKSIINGTTSSYQFIKTLSYDDYLAYQAASTDEWVVVPTHFKTTKESSDCDVYVANQYFHTNHGSFTTFTMHDFTNLRFSNNSLTDPDQPVTFSFNMDASDVPQKVTLKLTGLKPAVGSPLIQVGTNTYEYSTTGANVVNISLLTSTDDGYYRADISANHYNDAYHDNLLEYINPGFTGTSVPFGVGKNVPFRFTYQNSAIGEPVTFTLSNLTPPSGDTRFESQGGDKWRFTPSNSTATQNFNFVTTTAFSEVSVTMSGDSYTVAGPFKLSATLTVASQSLAFTRTTGTRPQNGATVNVHTTTGVVVGSFTVNNNRYNSAAFDIDLSKFSANENVYFSFDRDGNTNYTTSTYTLTQLSNATTGSRLTITGTTTTRPW